MTNETPCYYCVRRAIPRTPGLESVMPPGAVVAVVQTEARNLSMDVREGKLGLSTSVFAVVLTYAFLASVWILLSDRAMAVMVGASVGAWWAGRSAL